MLKKLIRIYSSGTRLKDKVWEKFTHEPSYNSKSNYCMIEEEQNSDQISIMLWVIYEIVS